MQEINVFIASSYELSDWREAIGDTIRVLNEEKEPMGYRIICLRNCAPTS